MAGFPASNKIPYLENVRQIIFVHFNEIFERINLRENYFWDTYFVGRGDFCIQNLKFLKIYFYGDMFQLTFYSSFKKFDNFIYLWGFLWGGVSLTPFHSGKNHLVRLKLGHTPLGHLKISDYQFLQNYLLVIKNQKGILLFVLPNINLS